MVLLPQPPKLPARPRRGVRCPRPRRCRAPLGAQPVVKLDGEELRVEIEDRRWRIRGLGKASQLRAAEGECAGRQEPSAAR